MRYKLWSLLFFTCVSLFSYQVSRTMNDGESPYIYNEMYVSTALDLDTKHSKKFIFSHDVFKQDYFVTIEPLHNYTCNQLKLYFEREGFSEKEILNQPSLYFSDEFVKCVKQYPGYVVAIKALHKQFKNMGITKKLVSIVWRGDYRAGLKKRINQLYNEIKIKNPLIIKPSLSNAQCNEYKELQRVYNDISPSVYRAIEKRLKAQYEIENGKEYFSTKSYLIDKNISQILQNNGYFTNEFVQCSGNQLQQIIHQEAIDILQNLSLLSPHSIIHPYQNGLVDCIAAMSDYNQQGFIDNAAMIGDFCWTLLDYGQAVAEGVALGLYATAQDFVEHPIMTAITAVAGKAVLTYQLCKIAYNVAGIGITIFIDPDKGKDEWNNYIAPVTQLISAIDNRQVTVRDCIKGGSAFATGLIAQGKLLRGLNKFCKTTHKNALTFIKNNPLSDPKQFAATPEGLLFRVTASSNKFENFKKFTISSELKNNIERKISKNIIPEFIQQNRIPLDRETILHSESFQKTKIPPVKGAQVYAKDNLFYHRDTLHKGKRAHLEVYNKRGIHLGEADPLTGQLINNTVDKTKKLNF